MVIIDKYVQQQIEFHLEKVLSKVNNYLTNIDDKDNSFSIKDLYSKFNDLLQYNEYLEHIDVDLVRRYKTTIERFPRYFQKYCNLYSNHITKIIKKSDDNYKALENLSKEELINIIRSKQ